MLITDTPYSAFRKSINGHSRPITNNLSTKFLYINYPRPFNEFSLANPLKSSTVISVADAFLEFFICTFGAPKSILTDRGSNFMSNMMKRFAKKFKIKQFKTTAFYPQANRALERSHSVLIEFSKQFVDRFTKWDKLVRCCFFI